MIWTIFLKLCECLKLTAKEEVCYLFRLFTFIPQVPSFVPARSVSTCRVNWCEWPTLFYILASSVTSCTTVSSRAGWDQRGTRVGTSVALSLSFWTHFLCILTSCRLFWTFSTFPHPFFTLLNSCANLFCFPAFRNVFFPSLTLPRSSSTLSHPSLSLLLPFCTLKGIKPNPARRILITLRDAFCGTTPYPILQHNFQVTDYKEVSGSYKR